MNALRDLLASPWFNLASKVIGLAAGIQAEIFQRLLGAADERHLIQLTLREQIRAPQGPSGRESGPEAACAARRAGKDTGKILENLRV